MKWSVILAVLLCHVVQASPDPHIGTGVWIWQLKKTDRGDVSKIVARAKAAHLDYVMIRVTSDGDRWASFNSKTKVRELARGLRAAGIRVFAWGYHFPQSRKMDSQIRMIKSVLADPVFDGYVYNVETEFAYQSKSAKALFAPVKAYRDKYFPGKLTGFSTYSRVERGAGASMPADTFADYCDVGMPQAYWRTFGWSPKRTIREMCVAWSAKVNPGYVLIPTGHAYDGAPGTNTQYIPAREVAEFLKASRNYFGRNLWAWERMTPEQWEVIQLGWAPWFAKYGKTSSSDERFAGETKFRTARATEHTWWAGEGIFQTHDNMVTASDQGWLVAPPAWLKQSCFRLATGIGKRDKSYRSRYLTASPEVWEAIRQLSDALRAEKVSLGRFRLESLARCVSYALGQGSKTSSHNFGGAFDIDLDDTGLSAVELSALHRALYSLARKKGIVYYMEADSAVRGKIPTFAVPYNPLLGGQMHVVAKPTKATRDRLATKLKPAPKSQPTKPVLAPSAPAHKKSHRYLLGWLLVALLIAYITVAWVGFKGEARRVFAESVGGTPREWVVVLIACVMLAKWLWSRVCRKPSVENALLIGVLGVGVVAGIIGVFEWLFS